MEGQKQIRFKTKEDDLKGVYSNLTQILHTKEEFILDFFLAAPPEGILISRVIMSPGHIKRLIKALQENISKYETKFGKIEEAKTLEIPEGGMGFKVEK
ncbi:hypothetical protein AMJ48_03175 [Parcubacteria bacterium DG_74_1]|nr:MAG: hypothetical protein AMJ48_03175 [Parcubacteria bacterium DG_74_1]